MRLALAVLTLQLAGCAPAAPQVEAAPSFEIDRIQTWQWLRGASVTAQDDPRLASDALHELLRAALEEGLASRGLRQVERGGDVEVAYRVAIERQRRVESEPIERPVGNDVFLGIPRVDVRDEDKVYGIRKEALPDAGPLLEGFLSRLQTKE